MFRLVVDMGVIRPPNLDDFSLLVVPNIIKFKKLGKPIKTFSSLTNECENMIFIIFTNIHLGIMRVGGVVRSHHL